MTNRDRVAEFISELNILFLKHQLYIDCGPKDATTALLRDMSNPGRGLGSLYHDCMAAILDAE